MSQTVNDRSSEKVQVHNNTSVLLVIILPTMSSVQEQIAELGLQPVAFIAVAAVFMTLAITAIALRVYVRAYMLRTWGLDDTLLVIAGVSRCRIVPLSDDAD